jgi:DnaJ domain
MRSSGPDAVTVADAYSVLGVKPRASIQEVRAAWLRLVKELHPDAGFDHPTASEHLKAINLAYQTLKDVEQGHAVGNAERRTFRSARATFVIFLLLPIVGGALIIGARTDWSLSSVATNKVTATNQEQEIGSGEARDTDEKRLIASQAHGSGKAGALAISARDPSGQAEDPTARPDNEPRSDLTMLETGAASDRPERKSSKTAALQDLNAYSSQSKPNASRELAPLHGAEHERGDDDAAWSDAQRSNTKGAFAADEGTHPKAISFNTIRAMQGHEVSPKSWVVIGGPKRGFQLSYPADVFLAKGGSTADDNRLLASADGRALMRVYFVRNRTATTPSQVRTSLLATRYAGATLDYAPRREFWFVLSGTLGDETFYERVIFSCDRQSVHGWLMTYPVAERQIYDALLEQINRTYHHSWSEDWRCAGAEAANIIGQVGTDARQVK